jgi:hypothetical protein
VSVLQQLQFLSAWRITQREDWLSGVKVAEGSWLGRWESRIERGAALYRAPWRV